MISITVNGKRREVDVAPSTPLLWVLRDTLGLTGTKYGCGISQCGACTVHVDGMATRTCVTPVSTVEGAKVTTIEGLASDGLHVLQEAWLDRSAPRIHAEARVARQRTCPIGELVGPDREDRFLEYKSTLRWDVREGCKAGVIELTV